MTDIHLLEYNSESASILDRDITPLNISEYSTIIWKISTLHPIIPVIRFFPAPYSRIPNLHDPSVGYLTAEQQLNFFFTQLAYTPLLMTSDLYLVTFDLWSMTNSVWPTILDPWVVPYDWVLLRKLCRLLSQFETTQTWCLYLCSFFFCLCRFLPTKKKILSNSNNTWEGCYAVCYIHISFNSPRPIESNNRPSKFSLYVGFSK